MNHGGLDEIISSRQAPGAVCRSTEPFFNHGLGCITKGTKDAESIAKSRGLTPMGNEVLNTSKFEQAKRNDDSKAISNILKEGMTAARVGKTLEGKPLNKVIKKRD